MGVGVVEKGGQVCMEEIGVFLRANSLGIRTQHPNVLENLEALPSLLEAGLRTLSE